VKLIAAIHFVCTRCRWATTTLKRMWVVEKQYRLSLVLQVLVQHHLSRHQLQQPVNLA